MNAEPPRYPYRFARDGWAALAEVLGEAGRVTVLNAAGITTFRTQPPPATRDFGVPFVDFAAINAALDVVYGERGGRDLAVRIGREWFAGGLRTFGVMAAMTDDDFRRLPLDDRARLGLTALADVFGHFGNQPSQLAVTPVSYRFSAASPFAEGVVAPRPVCHIFTGLLTEALAWFSNGRTYSVREIQCRAAGAPACTFSIARQPVS